LVLVEQAAASDDVLVEVGLVASEIAGGNEWGKAKGKCDEQEGDESSATASRLLWE
jgi:hypothetical protein